MTISKRKAEKPPPFGVRALHGRVVTTKRSTKVKFFPARRTPSPQKISSHNTPRKSTPRRRNVDDFNDEAIEFQLSDTEIEASRLTNWSKSSNDYMAEWLPKQWAYLNELLAREFPATDLECSMCSVSDAPSWWRCEGCTGSPIYCGNCCRIAHDRTPFHRVAKKEGPFFSPSWLWNCGVSVNLCPTRTCEPNDMITYDDPDTGEAASSEWTEYDDFTFGAKPEKRTVHGMRVLVVVHTNGVHHLPFHFCHCLDAVDHEYQLLRHGFYPSTAKETRTVFTFELLDEYLLDSLETFTSTHHFYSKLRRLTNEPFPHVVPDRTRELRRAGRQWRHLKDLKRHGFAHTKETPGEGSLAFFCAACPQPGINIPDDWEKDPEAWKYSRSFVADGNFTCVHRKGRNDANEDSLVYLRNGEGFVAEKDAYAEHIRVSVEVKEAPTCHEHRAVADKSKTHKGCDVTGIGALACMRHGAFAPGSVVDFQKGERQMNMDWALCQGIRLSNTDGIKRVILAYDINCQYNKRLRQRIEEGKYLKLRADLVLVFGIGLFHVHGHQDACNARYSLTYIEGAGISSGEILESLWAVVNEVARATSTMTLAHRVEILDAIFGDSNWKKMLNLVPSICKNWSNAKLQYTRAQEDFDLLDETATALQRRRWTQQLEQANQKREEGVIGAMDVLNAKIKKPPTFSKVQSTLMEKEQRSNKGVGITSWLALGIAIQQRQIQLKEYIKSLPKEKTDSQQLEVTKRREQLHADIGTFYMTAASLFPGADLDSLKYDGPPVEAVEIEAPVGGEDDEDIVMDDVADDNPFSLSQNEIEEVKVPLPSSFDANDSGIAPSLLGRARKRELELRIAQAEDALESIRTHIAHKSFLYRSNVRLAEGKKQKTRGYAAVKAVDKHLRHEIKVYNQARWALRRLGADENTRLRYRPIVRDDTRAVTAIYKPNARGERNKALPWIWNMNVAGDSSNSEYLEEIYRVNWLRAKSRVERWREEFILLSSEMEWVVNFFLYKEEECHGWASVTKNSPGHYAYAKRQADMWRLMAVHAREAFEKTKKPIPGLFESSVVVN
ncbi:hypothetical protein CC1G_09452 [Coprinopsis cinerea okayama7|uniref:CxC2-like cysteine cluster KDZ transposase-associated domain-containing protein n=1 Tax=Coprinopsis cinerea (strain Okayama-7 / 130 / ATCC MYA-4618 / FGSC 9003) TaxID=240176 RepID=A8PDB7_COPC7|nr:hypothetical protein CC1G_09452 [Coprinopsis cinerea okayama7\|eukprot:XP_001840568.2 hypothetical protein CC1G_09452 [Coprinopsis cinerea okayama7\